MASWDDSLSLGAEDYTGDDDDLGGLAQFISKPTQRRFQPFGGPKRQPQQPTFGPQQGLMGEQASQMPSTGSPFDDLSSYDDARQKYRYMSADASAHNASATMWRGRYDDFMKDTLGPYAENMGLMGYKKGSEDELFASLEESYAAHGAAVSEDDGFFGPSKHKKDAQSRAGDYKMWDSHNGLRERYFKLRREAETRSQMADQYNTVKVGMQEQLSAIPHEQRAAFDQAKGAGLSRRKFAEFMGQFDFGGTQYDPIKKRVIGLERSDPRAWKSLGYDPINHRSVSETADRIQGDRLAAAQRGDVKGLFARRDQTSKVRRMRDRGIMTSDPGGAPVGLSRKDQDLLDMDTLRQLGESEYKGVPIQQAIDMLGGEERLELSRFLRGVYETRVEYLNAQKEFLKLAGSGKRESAQKKMHVAREHYEKAVATAAEYGLAGEVFDQAVSPQDNVGIWRGMWNAIQRGFKASELSEYTDDFLTNTVDADEMEKVIEISEDMADLPSSSVMQRFQKLGKTDFWGSVGKLLGNPLVIPEMVVESLSSFLPTYVKTGIYTVPAAAAMGAGNKIIRKGKWGMLAAGLMGARLNWGVSSFVLEYTGKILEEMEELGVDWRDPRIFAAAWNNEAIRDKMRVKAGKKAGGVALMDTVSALVAGHVGTAMKRAGMGGGKLLDATQWKKAEKSVPRFTRPQRAKLAAGELGVGMGTGMSGEMLGQYWAMEPGETFDYDAVVAEGIVELAGPGMAGAIFGNGGILQNPDKIDLSDSMMEWGGERPYVIDGSPIGGTGTITRGGMTNSWHGDFEASDSAAGHLMQGAGLAHDSPQGQWLQDYMARLYDMLGDKAKHMRFVLADRTPTANMEQEGSHEYDDENGYDLIYFNREKLRENPLGVMMHESGHVARSLLFPTVVELEKHWGKLDEGARREAFLQYIFKVPNLKESALDDAQAKIFAQLWKTTPDDVKAEEWFAFQWGRILVGDKPDKSIASPLKSFLEQHIRPSVEKYMAATGAPMEEGKYFLDREVLKAMGWSDIGFPTQTKMGQSYWAGLGGVDVTETVTKSWGVRGTDDRYASDFFPDYGDPSKSIRASAHPKGMEGLSEQEGLNHLIQAIGQQELEGDKDIREIVNTLLGGPTVEAMEGTGIATPSEVSVLAEAAAEGSRYAEDELQSLEVLASKVGAPTYEVTTKGEKTVVRRRAQGSAQKSGERRADGTLVEAVREFETKEDAEKFVEGQRKADKETADNLVEFIRKLEGYALDYADKEKGLEKAWTELREEIQARKGEGAEVSVIEVFEEFAKFSELQALSKMGLSTAAQRMATDQFTALLPETESVAEAFDKQAEDLGETRADLRRRITEVIAQEQRKQQELFLARKSPPPAKGTAAKTAAKGSIERVVWDKKTSRNKLAPSGVPKKKLSEAEVVKLAKSGDAPKFIKTQEKWVAKQPDSKAYALYLMPGVKGKPDYYAWGKPAKAGAKVETKTKTTAKVPEAKQADRNAMLDGLERYITKYARIVFGTRDLEHDEAATPEERAAAEDQADVDAMEEMVRHVADESTRKKLSDRKIMQKVKKLEGDLGAIPISVQEYHRSSAFLSRFMELMGLGPEGDGIGAAELVEILKKGEERPLDEFDLTAGNLFAEAKKNDETIKFNSLLRQMFKQEKTKDDKKDDKKETLTSKNLLLKYHFDEWMPTVARLKDSIALEKKGLGKELARAKKGKDAERQTYLENRLNVLDTDAYLTDRLSDVMTMPLVWTGVAPDRMQDAGHRVAEGIAEHGESMYIHHTKASIDAMKARVRLLEQLEILMAPEEYTIHWADVEVTHGMFNDLRHKDGSNVTLGELVRSETIKLYGNKGKGKVQEIRGQNRLREMVEDADSESYFDIDEYKATKKGKKKKTKPEDTRDKPKKFFGWLTPRQYRMRLRAAYASRMKPHQSKAGVRTHTPKRPEITFYSPDKGTNLLQLLFDRVMLLEDAKSDSGKVANVLGAAPTLDQVLLFNLVQNASTESRAGGAVPENREAMQRLWVMKHRIKAITEELAWAGTPEAKKFYEELAKSYGTPGEYREVWIDQAPRGVVTDARATTGVGPARYTYKGKTFAEDILLKRLWQELKAAHKQGLKMPPGVSESGLAGSFEAFMDGRKGVHAPLHKYLKGRLNAAGAAPRGELMRYQVPAPQIGAFLARKQVELKKALDTLVNRESYEDIYTSTQELEPTEAQATIQAGKSQGAGEEGAFQEWIYIHSRRQAWNDYMDLVWAPELEGTEHKGFAGMALWRQAFYHDRGPDKGFRPRTDLTVTTETPEGKEEEVNAKAYYERQTKKIHEALYKAHINSLKESNKGKKEKERTTFPTKKDWIANFEKGVAKGEGSNERLREKLFNAWVTLIKKEMVDADGESLWDSGLEDGLDSMFEHQLRTLFVKGEMPSADVFRQGGWERAMPYAEGEATSEQLDSRITLFPESRLKPDVIDDWARDKVLLRSKGVHMFPAGFRPRWDAWHEEDGMKDSSVVKIIIGKHAGVDIDRLEGEPVEGEGLTDYKYITDEEVLRKSEDDRKNQTGYYGKVSAAMHTDRQGEEVSSHGEFNRRDLDKPINMYRMFADIIKEATGEAPLSAWERWKALEGEAESARQAAEASARAEGEKDGRFIKAAGDAADEKVRGVRPPISKALQFANEMLEKNEHIIEGFYNSGPPADGAKVTFTNVKGDKVKATREAEESRWALDNGMYLYDAGTGPNQQGDPLVDGVSDIFLVTEAYYGKEEAMGHEVRDQYVSSQHITVKRLLDHIQKRSVSGLRDMAGGEKHETPRKGAPFGGLLPRIFYHLLKRMYEDLNITDQYAIEQLEKIRPPYLAEALTKEQLASEKDGLISYRTADVRERKEAAKAAKEAEGEEVVEGEEDEVVEPEPEDEVVEDTPAEDTPAEDAAYAAPAGILLDGRGAVSKILQGEDVDWLGGISLHTKDTALDAEGKVMYSTADRAGGRDRMGDVVSNTANAENADLTIFIRPKGGVGAVTKEITALTGKRKPTDKTDAGLSEEDLEQKYPLYRKLFVMIDETKPDWADIVAQYEAALDEIRGEFVPSLRSSGGPTVWIHSTGLKTTPEFTQQLIQALTDGRAPAPAEKAVKAKGGALNVFAQSRIEYLRTLSNFAMVEGGLVFDGHTFPNVEAAYQALKNKDKSEEEEYIGQFTDTALTGLQAQQLGKDTKPTQDGDFNLGLMERLLSARLQQDTAFAAALRKTTGRRLEHKVLQGGKKAKDDIWAEEFPRMLTELREKATGYTFEDDDIFVNLPRTAEGNSIIRAVLSPLYQAVLDARRLDLSDREANAEAVQRDISAEAEFYTDAEEIRKKGAERAGAVGEDSEMQDFGTYDTGESQADQQAPDSSFTQEAEPEEGTAADPREDITDFDATFDPRARLSAEDRKRLAAGGVGLIKSIIAEHQTSDVLGKAGVKGLAYSIVDFTNRGPDKQVEALESFFEAQGMPLPPEATSSEMEAKSNRWLLEVQDHPFWEVMSELLSPEAVPPEEMIAWDKWKDLEQKASEARLKAENSARSAGKSAAEIADAGNAADEGVRGPALQEPFNRVAYVKKLKGVKKNLGQLLGSSIQIRNSSLPARLKNLMLAFLQGRARDRGREPRKPGSLLGSSLMQNEQTLWEAAQGKWKTLTDPEKWSEVGSAMSAKEVRRRYAESVGPQGFLRRMRLDHVDSSLPHKELFRDFITNAGIEEDSVTADAINVYGKEHIYFGQGYTDVQQGRLNYHEPYMEALRDSKVEPSVVGEWFQAQAAPSRNIHHRKQYDDMLKEAREKKNKDKYAELVRLGVPDSRIPTEAALARVKQIEAKPEFIAFMEHKNNPIQVVYDMNLADLDNRVDSSLIDVEERQRMISAMSYFDWSGKSKFVANHGKGVKANYRYMPMQGFKDETQSLYDKEAAWEILGSPAGAAGKGFDQPNSKLLARGAFGTFKREDGTGEVVGPDPLMTFSYAERQHSEGMIRMNKNKVANSFGDLHDMMRAIAKGPEPDNEEVREVNIPGVDIKALHENEEVRAKISEEYDRIFKTYIRKVPTTEYSWTSTADVVDGKASERFRVIRKEISQEFKNDPWIFTFRRLGVPMYIEFARTPEGAEHAQALKNLRYASLPEIMTWFQGATRFMSQMVTSKNPGFMIPNLAKDYGTAWVNLGEKASTREFRREALNFKEIGRFSKAIWRAEVDMNIKNKNPFDMRKLEVGPDTAKKLLSEGDYVKMYMYAKKEGALVGYFRHSTPVEMIEKLQKEVDPNKPGQIKKMWGNFWKYTDALNSMAENSIRISTFWAAINNGFTAQQAAILSRNVTVDFNQGGNLSQSMNALYMFYRASSNAIDRTWTMFKNRGMGGRHGVGMLAGKIIGASYAIAMINRIMDDDEEETEPQYDQVSRYVRDRNIVMGVPKFISSTMGIGEDGANFRLPLPLGAPAALFGVGQVLADWTANFAMDRGGTGLLSGVLRLAGSLTDAANPLGTGNVVTMLTPSPLTPAMELFANKDFMGRDIVYRQNPFSTPEPAHMRDPKRTPAFFAEFSKLINGWGGGSDATYGSINGLFGQNPLDYSEEEDIKWDLSGNQIRHVINGYLGGPWQVIEGTAGLFTADPNKWNNLPVAKRFYRASTYGGNTKNKLYRLEENIGQAKRAVKLAEAAGPAELKAVRAQFQNQLKYSKKVAALSSRSNAKRRLQQKVEDNKSLSDDIKAQRVAKLESDWLFSVAKVINAAQKDGMRL